MGSRRTFFILLGGLLLQSAPRTLFAAFTLGLDQSSINFNELQLGQESGDKPLQIQPLSDDPSGWSIQIEAQPFTHSDAVTVFPADSLKYRFLGDFPGVEVPASPAQASVLALPQTIYSASSPSECSLSSCSYGMAFRLQVSDNQKAGNYSTSILFTMVSNE